jgi:hypothetical protein
LADTVPIWVPVATAFGGFLSSGILEWLKDERASSRETETRRAQRVEARQDRRDDSQIETIKALQKAMYDYALAARDHAYESKQHEGVSDATFNRVEAVQADVLFYEVRILDDSARDLVDAFAKVADSHVERPSEASDTEMSKAHRRATERLGEIYRKLL